MCRNGQEKIKGPFLKWLINVMEIDFNYSTHTKLIKLNTHLL